MGVAEERYRVTTNEIFCDCEEKRLPRNVFRSADVRNCLADRHPTGIDQSLPPLQLETLFFFTNLLGVRIGRHFEALNWKPFSGDEFCTRS